MGLELTDAEFYEVVVDFVEWILGSSSLDNVNIFSTNGLLDFASRLSNRKF